jgi:hypothetical protein
VAGDDQQQHSASPPSTKSAESERRRLSSSQPGMAKRHSSETLYKAPLRSSPVSSVLDGTAATTTPTTTTGAGTGLQLLDLEHVVKSKKRSGDVARLQSPVSSGEVSPEREGASSDGGGGGKNSPRRKDQASHDEERKKEKTSSRETSSAPEPDTVSPRRRQPSPRDKSESDEQQQSESEAGGSTPKKSSTTGKLYAEITRGVRTHLRAASDSLRDHDRTPPVTPSPSASSSSSSSSLDERDTSEKADNHHREASNKEKREKKEKHDKKENVIVRLFGSERHHKDKGPASSASTSASTSAGSGSAKVVPVVPVVREEVEIQITGPRVDPADGDRRVLMVHSGCGTVGAGGVVTTLTTMPSPPVSPFPMHKSGIRLIKVDSEHCINLPLVNSEITAQKTSSKAVSLFVLAFLLSFSSFFYLFVFNFALFLIDPRARTQTKLLWEKPPSVVLIIKKPRDPVITQQLCALARYALVVPRFVGAALTDGQRPRAGACS